MSKKINLGLIGILQEEFKSDFWSTAKRVADLGYKGLEGGADTLLKGDPRENLKRFHDLGLRVLTVGAMREQLRDDLPKVIADCKALQCDRVSMWWAPCDTREAILKDADLYNTAGATLIAEGIKLCYHNHNHEFQHIIDGVYALDFLAANTDPKAVFFELDIAWLFAGAQDPSAVLKRYAGRVPAIHIKDLSKFTTEKEQSFTAVGSGVVPVREAVQTAIDLGIEWGVVEQDKLRNLRPWDTVTVSYLNLKEYGLV